MRVGVIGTGSMGRNHARVYASLAERCRFVGVYDRDEERAAAVAAQYGGEAFRTLPELLAQVDAVSVAVPTPAHYRVGMACVRRNVHVLMEKPITETVGQAKALIEQSRTNGVVLQTGHIELFNPTVQALKKLLAGEEIVGMELQRLRPLEPRMARSDVVSDAMIHDIYIVHHLLGTRIRHLHAAGRRQDRYTQHASALLRLEDGAVVQLTASYLTDEKVRTIRVVTRRSVIVADLLTQRIRVSSLSEPGESRWIDVPDGEPLRLELLHFLDAVARRRSPDVTGEDGLDALALANRIIRKVSVS
ncbi:Gfo/Idh/MocA family oxidoreductase [Paenibacillus sp.]|uniref:Gfo/Idh/MocA family oxidoreductase n=1 Tax=Paenibacillus sp. TaxID=58172 RepID=UPI0028124B8D|nr:Gfo/Idh/MocA family oxidoreductase [Paenibacillus sp.]